MPVFSFETISDTGLSLRLTQSIELVHISGQQSQQKQDTHKPSARVMTTNLNATSMRPSAYGHASGGRYLHEKFDHPHRVQREIVHTFLNGVKVIHVYRYRRDSVRKPLSDTS